MSEVGVARLERVVPVQNEVSQGDISRYLRLRETGDTGTLRGIGQVFHRKGRKAGGLERGATKWNGCILYMYKILPGMLGEADPSIGALMVSFWAVLLVSHQKMVSGPMLLL